MPLSRRRILIALPAMAFGAAFAARAQAPGRGVVLFNRAPELTDAFVAGLRDHGLDDPRKVAFEAVKDETNEMTTREIERAIGRNADVLVMPGPARITAAIRLTRKIPVVGIDLESDPVAAGFVKSLARPGGNVTGIWLDIPELASKQFQFLREMVPGIAAAGILWDDRVGRPHFEAAQAAARASSITLHAAAVRSESEADAAVGRLAQSGARAIIALTSPAVYMSRSRIAEASLKQGLPLFSMFSTHPEVGALLGYGPNVAGMFRQAAGYVFRILRGAKPAEIPVERPVRFELVLNRRTAKALGMTIPGSQLVRADRVIE